MPADLIPYEKALLELEERGRRRFLSPAYGVDFCSNDYLGLKSHPRMRAAIGRALDDGMEVGAGGSRLLRGNHPAHEELETQATRWFGAGGALFMATGYLANLAVMSCLPQRRDAIIYDELMHASGKEGIRASVAKSSRARHNDPASFEEEVKRWRAAGRQNIFIYVESVYSMDGDMAPLRELAALAARYDAFLVVDEAHATGVHGPAGRGLAAALEGQDNIICIHTCGKALGAAGALVTLPAVLRDYMVNSARSFIFTTAPSPLMALAVSEALCIIDNEPERLDRLGALMALAHEKLLAVDGADRTVSQILPVHVGEDAAAVALAQAIQAEGYDVRAVRPPTVPEGTARLRLSITLNATAADVQGVADCISNLREAAS